MASSLFRRASDFLRSPRGKRAIEQARRQAGRPENRTRIASLLRRLRGTRRG